MAASIGLIDVRILISDLLYFSYFISDFDWVCGRLHGLIRACMLDSHAYKIAVPFKTFFQINIGITNIGIFLWIMVWRVPRKLYDRPGVQTTLEGPSKC